MTTYEMHVPYVLDGHTCILTMRVVAASPSVAVSVASARALAVRPLLGGDGVRFPEGGPRPLLAVASSAPLCEAG